MTVFHPAASSLAAGHPVFGTPTLVQIPKPKVVSVEDEKRGPGHALFSKTGHEWRLDVGPRSLVGNPTDTRREATNIALVPPLSIDSGNKISYDNTANNVAIAALTAAFNAAVADLQNQITTNLNNLTSSLAAETAARIAADSAETTARALADTNEANARIAADLTLQPIPTSSTDYRVGTVMFCKTTGSVNNNATIAGTSLRTVIGSLVQWYYSDGTDTVPASSNTFNPIYTGSPAAAVPHFQIADSVALTGTWKNISGSNLVANTGGLFVRTA